MTRRRCVEPNAGPLRTRRFPRTNVVRVTCALTLATIGLGSFGCLPQVAVMPDVPAVTEAVVTAHTDGDTAHFRLEGGTEEKVRFIGIDTPEVGENLEPFGDEAAAYTADAIPLGTTVWLETDAELRDRHGRLLAYVWLDRPVSGDEAEMRASMLNARLLLDGYAQTLTVPPNVRHADLFRTLQTEARDAGAGLWAEPSADD